MIQLVFEKGDDEEGCLAAAVRYSYVRTVITVPIDTVDGRATVTRSLELVMRPAVSSA